jgi:hypothetical protein
MVLPNTHHIAEKLKERVGIAVGLVLKEKVDIETSALLTAGVRQFLRATHLLCCVTVPSRRLYATKPGLNQQIRRAIR